MPVNTRRGGPPAGGFQELPDTTTRKRKPRLPKPAPTSLSAPEQTKKPSLPKNPLEMSAAHEQQWLQSQKLTAEQQEKLRELQQSHPSDSRQFLVAVHMCRMLEATPGLDPIDAALTTLAEAQKITSPSTNRKRVHEDDSNDEPNAKRPHSEKKPPIDRTPQIPFSPFDPNRKRSAILAPRTPASRRSNLRKTQSARQPIKTLPSDDAVKDIQSLGPKSAEKAGTVTPESPALDTPSRSTITGMITGSIRGFKRMIWGPTETSAANEPQTAPIQPNPFAINSLPKPASQLNRRMKKKTTSNKQPTHIQPSVEEDTQEQDFETVQVEGTKKRKMDNNEETPSKKLRFNADENGNITGRFGIPDDFDDDDEEEVLEVIQEIPAVVNVEELEHFRAPFMKPKGILKRPQGERDTSNPRKEVTWYPNKGPAGEYRGTLFNTSNNQAELTPTTGNAFAESTSTTTSVHGSAGGTPGYKPGFPNYDDMTPNTIGNTYGNVVHGHVDTVLTAQNDQKGTAAQQQNNGEQSAAKETAVAAQEAAAKKAKITNPTGHFSADYEGDDDESIIEEGDSEPTPVPNAPKISHAALPGSNDRPESADRLSKARQEAQQYKPKNASRLSHVSPARSSSSSPPPAEASTRGATPKDIIRTIDEITAGIEAEKRREEREKKMAAAFELGKRREDRSDAMAAAFEIGKRREELGQHGQIHHVQEEQVHEGQEEQAPETSEEAEQRRVDEDKMREAEEWASKIEWPKFKTYVEAGLCSPYIDNLIRERWTEEDDRITHEWWTNEFQDVDRMAKEAKSQGKTLELIHE